MTKENLSSAMAFLNTVAKNAIAEKIISDKIADFIKDLDSILQSNNAPISICCEVTKTNIATSGSIKIKNTNSNEERRALSFFVMSYSDQKSGEISTTYNVSDSTDKDLVDTEHSFLNLETEDDYNKVLDIFKSNLHASITIPEAQLIAEALKIQIKPAKPEAPKLAQS